MDLFNIIIITENEVYVDDEEYRPTLFISVHNCRLRFLISYVSEDEVSIQSIDIFEEEDINNRVKDIWKGKYCEVINEIRNYAKR